MAPVRFPLSGDVAKAFRFLTSSFSAAGSLFGFIDVHLARSPAPEVEQGDREVGSYGRQLGRIGDAVAVLLAHTPVGVKLDERERKALAAFTAVVDEIDDVKRRRGRSTLRP